MDDLKNTAEGLAGGAKESIGNATGDESLANEGRADQVKSEAKGKISELKDKATDKANEVLGNLKKD
ncbi:CsbD family protein [Corynebacterium terpenotabidum]|uniref:CsbD family protein n=1 Tax=Corynebacterium terpenotabidum TaxID=89154 RepID=UPI001B7F7C47|nr:CsbD family protein [Corynebacterium terpenotabidum]